nr:hypothetical protein CFP56_50868 [Quercus suber]
MPDVLGNTPSRASLSFHIVIWSSAANRKYRNAVENVVLHAKSLCAKKRSSRRVRDDTDSSFTTPLRLFNVEENPCDFSPRDFPVPPVSVHTECISSSRQGRSKLDLEWIVCKIAGLARQSVTLRQTTPFQQILGVMHQRTSASPAALRTHSISRALNFHFAR